MSDYCKLEVDVLRYLQYSLALNNLLAPALPICLAHCV